MLIIQSKKYHPPKKSAAYFAGITVKLNRLHIKLITVSRAAGAALAAADLGFLNGGYIGSLEHFGLSNYGMSYKDGVFGGDKVGL